MRLVPVAMLGLALASFIACDESGEPDCRTEECQIIVDGGTFSDGALPLPPGADDGGVPPPPPFDPADAGTTPTCKGLFELCSGPECCSPYGCTSGTCR